MRWVLDWPEFWNESLDCILLSSMYISYTCVGFNLSKSSVNFFDGFLLWRGFLATLRMVLSGMAGGLDAFIIYTYISDEGATSAWGCFKFII